MEKTESGFEVVTTEEPYVFEAQHNIGGFILQGGAGGVDEGAYGQSVNHCIRTEARDHRLSTFPNGERDTPGKFRLELLQLDERGEDLRAAFEFDLLAQKFCLDD